MKIMKKIFLVLAVVGPVLFLSNAQLQPKSQKLKNRITENLNTGWQYLENNLTDILELGQHENWQSIDLPHTWNQWDAVDNTPGYRRDASWYQKEVFIDDYEQARFVLSFEGVNITSDIYINAKHAGSHVGGYVGFDIDISKYVKKGQKNTIAIRVDNSYNPNVIPSQKADFFIYGGITRDVWLKILPDVYIQNTLVSTPKVSSTMAETTVALKLGGNASLSKDHSVYCTILDGSTQQVVTNKIFPYTQLKNAANLSLPAFKSPKLWSPAEPHLYILKVQLKFKDQIIDEVKESIGYRFYEFEDYGAFFLNGKRLLLRGTHRHEEHAGLGAAMSNAMHRKDVEQMKEMGVNFLRLGHYPQDPEVYKACNELGIIVWDELPWCRGGMGGETWKANTERLLVEQIRQNYNHPSILFWSLGNEIYWLPDFENGDDEENLNSYVAHLNKVAHDLDPNRMTSIRKYYAGAELVDVFSPSIWSGWYAGVYTNYQNTLTENQEKYPRFLHMEYGGSSHVGRHTENPITGDGSMNEDDWAEVANQVNIKNIAKSGDWTENYIVDLFDWYLGVTETKKDFTGNAQWAFKDFGTPLRPENAIPYLNQKGLVDRAGNPKDAYYVFKSYWSDDPFVYIESHTWTEREGPKGKTRNVSTFSNCEEVELHLNGKNLGKKQRVLGAFPACGLNWDVLFKAGKNDLIAHGYENGQKISSDTMSLNYRYGQADKADHIELSSRRLDNGNYLVEAVMLDKNNLRVLDYERHLYFSQDGAGELLVNYGTPTRSLVIQMANGYAAIELKPATSGKTIIEARNQDFKGSYHVIDFSETAGHVNKNKRSKSK
jgi:beta-galactosidase